MINCNTWPAEPAADSRNESIGRQDKTKTLGMDASKNWPTNSRRVSGPPPEKAHGIYIFAGNQAAGAVRNLAKLPGKTRRFCTGSLTIDGQTATVLVIHFAPFSLSSLSAKQNRSQTRLIAAPFGGSNGN